MGRAEQNLNDYKSELFKLLKNRVRRKILVEIINARSLDAINRLIEKHLSLSQQDKLALEKFKDNREKYKKNVLEALDNKINDKLIIEINECKSIANLNQLLKDKLSTELQHYLKLNEIIYFEIIPNTRIKRDYFDCTKNSVRAILTPMGT